MGNISSHIVEIPEHGFSWVNVYLIIIPVIYLCLFVLVVYTLVLLVKYLRRGIKYYDMKLNEDNGAGHEDKK